MRHMVVFVLAGMLIGVGACSDGSPSSGEPQRSVADEGTSPAPAAMPRTVTGTVVETMDASSYTYVQVDVGEETIWAATNRFEVAVGDRVTVPLESPMENFHSDTLDRDFPLIYFASRIVGEGESPDAATPVDRALLGPGTPQVAAEVEEGAIAPAPGGRTVASVWADAPSIAGTEVTVRGQVVKFNPAIMGTNWIHIQDGTGDADAGTHDLTVTSAAAVAVGDVVTATGVVAVDQDFGAGYVYPVMVRDAAVE
jgi:hypothetical protein